MLAKLLAKLKNLFFANLKKSLLILIGGASILFIIFYVYIWKDLPTPDNLYQYDLPQTTKILDRNEELLYKIYIDQDRTIVPLSQIPLSLQQATIAIEDKDFYQHPGFNPVGGVLRAMSSIMFEGKLEGGSTITQQLMKNTLLTPERTIQRKIKEIILAVWAEILYSKKEILEMYLNTVPYGGTAWGVESAARKYFAKDVKELTLAESALLAGLPAAPTTYSPFGAHPELAKQRQKEVLRRMIEDKYISQKELNKALNEELKFLFWNIIFPPKQRELFL